ncbi:MAG: hypothetical protein ABI925_00815 [Verrucomicrobiota bacterium]
MKRTIHFLLCLASIAALAATADAAGRPPKKKTVPMAVPSATAGPASSADLSRFMGAHLDTILGPLDQKVDLPRAELAQIRDSFAKGFGKASLAERQKFQSGLAVCDAISQAMDERNKAVVIKASATWPQQAAQLRQRIDQLAAQQRAAEGH